MKLYTEEQIAEAVMFGRWGGTMKKDYEEFLNKLTPIELPSDEEIEEYDDGSTKLNPRTYYDAFQEGAKWMKDKILQQNIG